MSETLQGGGAELRAGEMSPNGSTANGGRVNGRRGRGDGEGLANFLGWFSIGLGVAQVVAPERMARLVGASGDETSVALMRAVGLREIAAGLGIVAQRHPTPWVWGRVAGDTMDLALLGNTMVSNPSERERTAAAAAAVLGVTALDVLCAQRLSRSGASARSAKEEGIEVNKSITVNRPAEEVYNFWHNFENLPRFMSHLESVEVTSDRRSHWTAKGPAGTTVEWDAQTTDDVPNELIAWRSTADADVENAGSVRFKPAAGGRGTEVHVELRYKPPAGKLGAAVAKLFGEEPNQQVAGDLRRFKQVMETGEVVHSDASIHKGMHPAQPSKKRTARPEESEQRLVVERSADAAARTSSNLDRTSTTARRQDLRV